MLADLFQLISNSPDCDISLNYECHYIPAFGLMARRKFVLHEKHENRFQIVKYD